MKTNFTLRGLVLGGVLLGSQAMASAAISTSPVTPGATEAAQKLYTFLVDNYGKKTISGVMTGDQDGASSLATQKDVAAVLSADGNIYPALVGFDFIMATGAHSDEDWFKSYTQTGLSLASELWQKGGIPAFNWHWKVGSDTAFYVASANSQSTSFDYTKAFKSGSTTEFDETSEEYQLMIKDIDHVSELFLQLQKAGVAAIWRPLHEAAGGWFWWGAHGSEYYKSLYKMLYNRMVNVNGVKNLIWVWNIERDPAIGYDVNALNKAWYPGDEYVDVIGVDIYNNAYDYKSNSDYYKKITTEMGSDKMLALTENGPIVDPDNMANDGAVWSWWMPWYESWGSNFVSQTSSSEWTSAMNDSRIITLKDMAGWDTFIDACDTLNTEFKKEAECADYKGTLTTFSDQSGTGCVSMNDDADYINFTFDVATAGKYKVYIGINGAYGAKTFNCSVNGTKASVTGGATTEEIEVGSYKLAAGSNAINITPSWTWVPVDYVRIEADNDKPTPFTLSAVPVNANATKSARCVYEFLYNNFGSKTISGVMTGDMSTAAAGIKGHEDVKAVYTASGKYPALVGFDFMNATGMSASGSWYKEYTQNAIKLAKEFWQLGGIPAFTWHWRDPNKETDGFYLPSANSETNTNFDFTTAFKSGTTEWDETSTAYKNMVADIDVVADYFLQLQDSGVACIFRPLHEASGKWFWWGNQGGAAYQQLYRLVYNEMVNVKGVNNVIWVWNPEYATDADWNPGAEYYDVVSIDIYNDAYDYSSNGSAFKKLKTLTNASKMIALSENGPIPDIDNQADDEAMWSWWMPWYNSWSGNFVTGKTTNAEWTKVMNDERIITLDDTGDLVECTTGVENVDADDAAAVYPTQVSNYFMVNAENAKVVVTDAAGRVIVAKMVKGATSIPTTSWNKGVYVVTVLSADGSKSYKLVK